MQLFIDNHLNLCIKKGMVDLQLRIGYLREEGKPPD